MPSGSRPYQATYYTYNTLGAMIRVQQGSQDRYFMYDSLGRTLRIRQPEQEVNTSLNTSGNPDNNSWTGGFTYDNNGNVLTTTDAKGTTITNTYDALNRALTRTYSDGTPTVTNYYDGTGLPSVPAYSKGKLTKVASSVSESKYTEFDLLGRLKESQQVTDGNTYTSKYTYNLSGALVEEEYPSGRKVQNILDNNGDLSIVQSKKNAGSGYWHYADGFSYTAAGGVTKMQLGNGLWETAQFNTRQQVTQLGLGIVATDTSHWKIDYEFGELQTNGTVDATKNTGNIGKQTLTVPGTNFVQAYKYDPLDRLTEAKETTSTTQNWIQQFGYDRYGNRTSFSKTIGSTTTTSTPSIDASTNRFSGSQGFTYDANGNITQDADPLNSHVRAFTFNGDNKQTQVTDVTNSNHVVGTYYYDGEGKRVKKVTDTETTIFVYSAGKLVAEYSTNVTPVEDAKVAYTTADHLGSPRVITDQNGQIASRRDFMPFGEEIVQNVGGRTSGLQYGSTDDEVRQKFTGYQKDTETSLDFAEARMYENRFGRFTAVDPLLASGKSADPQTFNRYVYVGNNSINMTDPLGLEGDGNCNGRDVKCPDTKILKPGEKGNPIGEVTIYGSDTPSTAIDTTSTGVSGDVASRPLSLPCPPGYPCGSAGPSPPSLDMSNVEGSKVVEGIASAYETCSFIPGIGIPCAIAAGITRAGQGNVIGAGTNFAMVIPFGGFARRAGVAVHVAEDGLTGLALARELGIAGERAAGISGAKRAIQVGGRNLFPDQVTNFALTEVKNVQSLSLTRQLRDYATFTQGRRIPFFLVTRPGTKLSGPLRRAINDGIIVHRPTLPF